MVVEQAADRWGVALDKQGTRIQGLGEIDGHPVLLVLPLTWMNQAGMVVQTVLQDFSLAAPDLIVVHDDLDLPLGALRIKTRGGTGGHNRLRSIVSCLGTEYFSRIKFGIGRPSKNGDIVQFVLSPFPVEEWKQVVGILPVVVDALKCLICEGPAVAMNQFHVRPSS